MRNLKRALSLTLASVMLLGMMVVGSSAAGFPDVDENDNIEAIEVLQAIGVMVGDDNGNFAPDDQVNRSQMAVVMALLLDLDYNYYEGADPGFWDVPNWARPYVAACYANGIVSGYGNGQYGAADPITAVQAASMMMRALGYFQYDEDYKDGFELSTVRQASEIGLFSGINAKTGEFLTRNQVAKLALNTLEAKMVSFKGDTGWEVTSSDGTTIRTGYRADYQPRTGTEKKYGALGGTSTDIAPQGQYYIQLGEQLYDGDLTKKGAEDDFARPATEWRLKGERIGVYADEPDLTYTKQVKVGTIYTDLGLNRSIPTANVSVYVDGVEDSSQTPGSIKKGDETKKYGANGVLTEVFYDKDADTVIITEINTWTGEIARSVDAKGTKNAYVVVSPEDVKPANVGSTLNFETNATFEDDTRVLYTYSQSAEEVIQVAAAESVTGNVTKTENDKTDDTDRKALTLDGTRYASSAKNTGETIGEVIVKNEYTVYLDFYGYMIYVEETELDVSRYALVLDAVGKSSLNTNRALLLFTDGTTEVVDTAKNYEDDLENTIVTFRTDSNNVYTLTAVDAEKSFKITNAAADFNITNDKAGVTTTSNAKDYNDQTPETTVFNANSASVFVVHDQNDNSDPAEDFDVYVGIKNAPSMTAGKAYNSPTDDSNAKISAYWFCKTISDPDNNNKANGGMITVMFVFPSSAVKIDDGNSQIVYISKGSVSNLISDADIGQYYEYDITRNGEIVENQKVDGKVTINYSNSYTGMNTSTTANTKANLVGLFKSPKINKDGVITNLMPLAPYSNGENESSLVGTGIDKVSKEYTVILDTAGTPKTITVADDADIFYVDKDGNISVSSYRAIAVDSNDVVRAVVKDYEVQTLVIEEVENTTTAGQVDVDITADPADVIQGKRVVLTADVDLGRYDEVLSYQWYSSATQKTTLAGVEGATKIDGATRRTLTITSAPTAKTYYYCVVETANEKADKNAKSIGEYVMEAQVDVTSAIGVLVTYKKGDTEIGTEVVAVPTTLGYGTLTEDMLKKVPTYYKVTGWTDKTVSSSAHEFDVTVEVDKKNNVKASLSLDDVTELVEGTKFEGIEDALTPNLEYSVGDDGKITFESATLNKLTKDTPDEDGKILNALNVFWYGNTRTDEYQETLEALFTIMNAYYNDSREQMAIVPVCIEDQVIFVPVRGASPSASFTIGESMGLTTDYVVNFSALSWPS